MAQIETENFRANLRELCRERGTQAQAAAAAGISGVHVSNILRGKAVPSIDIAARLANALGCQLTELLANPKRFRENLKNRVDVA